MSFDSFNVEFEPLFDKQSLSLHIQTLLNQVIQHSKLLEVSYDLDFLEKQILEHCRLMNIKITIEQIHDICVSYLEIEAKTNSKNEDDILVIFPYLNKKKGK